VRLDKQEAILDEQPMTADDAHRMQVRFSHPTIGAPAVALNYQRWCDMDCPAQIKVTIEPVRAR
jgi:hypothetical protein